MAGPLGEFQPFGGGEMGGVFVGADADGPAGPLPAVRVKATDPAMAAAKAPPGPTSALVEFARTGSLAADLEVYYTLAGTATNGVDYKAVPTTLVGTPPGQVAVAKVVIPAGKGRQTVRLDALDDTLVEGGEGATVALSPRAGAYVIDAARKSAEVALADNDPFPDPVQQVWVAEYDLVAEEPSGPVNPGGPIANPGRIGLRRSLATGELAVAFSLAGSTAGADDADVLGGVLAAGEDTAWIEVLPKSDPSDAPNEGVEGAESVSVTLLAGPGYAVTGDATKVVTLYDVNVLTQPPTGWSIPPNREVMFFGTGSRRTTPYDEGQWPGPPYPPVRWLTGDAVASEAAVPGGDNTGRLFVASIMGEQTDPDLLWAGGYHVGGTAKLGVDYTLQVEWQPADGYHQLYEQWYQKGLYLTVVPIPDDEYKGPRRWTSPSRPSRPGSSRT